MDVKPSTKLEEYLRNAPEELKPHYVEILTSSAQPEEAQADFMTLTDAKALYDSLPKPVVHSTGWYDLNAICGGGIAEGEVVLLAAQAGVGKTHFGVNIAMNYARKGQPVFYLTMEDGWKMIYQRFEQLDPDGKANDEIVIIQEEQLTLKNAMTVLKRAADDVKLIIIDNLFSLPLRAGGKTDYWTSQAEWVDDLCSLVRSTDCSCLILHHLNKTPHGTESDRYQIAGSTRLVNRVAQVWLLSRSKDDPHAMVVRSAKNRRVMAQDGICFLTSDGIGRLHGTAMEKVDPKMIKNLQDTFKIDI